MLEKVVNFFSNIWNWLSSRAKKRFAKRKKTQILEEIPTPKEEFEQKNSEQNNFEEDEGGQEDESFEQVPLSEKPKKTI